MSAIRQFPKRMIGGLYFGPAGWRPQAWRQPPAVIPVMAAKNVTPVTNRLNLLAFIEQIALGRTDVFIAALFWQIKDLRQKPVKLLILNLLPTQPESAMGAALTDLELPYLRAGLELLYLALNPDQTVITLDRHDFATRKIWERVARKTFIEIKPLLNKYPQAHPLALLRVLCRQKMIDYTSPASGGILMIDPVTCWALGRAAAGEAHFSSRPVQVFIDGAEPILSMASIGQNISTFLGELGIAIADRECIADGMLAGRLTNQNLDRIESTTAILSVRPPPQLQQPADCIQCGWCVRACPTALNPAALLATAHIRGALPVANLNESQACIECGLCSYVCPSRLPLATTIHGIKQRQVSRAGLPIVPMKVSEPAKEGL